VLKLSLTGGGSSCSVSPKVQNDPLPPKAAINLPDNFLSNYEKNAIIISENIAKMAD
jgi:hypothetical protein